MSGRFNSETFSAPPAKFPRIAGPSTLSFCEGSVFAGEEFLQEFTEAKSLLNNALQTHLQRLNKKLDYNSKRILLSNGQQISRCTLYVPYPEPFTVVGEGTKTKDAERRAAAVACSKLQEGGFLQQGTNLANKLTEVEEDKKPRSIEVSISSQLQLFDAVSCLPGCESFARWNTIARYFNKRSSAPILQLAPPSNLQSDSYELTLQPAEVKVYEAVKQSVSLPQPLATTVTKGDNRSLGTVACPCCQQLLNICVTRKPHSEMVVKAPLLPLPTSGTTQSEVTTPTTDSSEANQRASSAIPSENHVICAFSGMPFVASTVELCQERNWSLQKRQETIEKTYLSTLSDSAICVARNLPIAASRNSIVTEVNSCQVVIISGSTGSGKTTQTPQYILENYIMYGVGSNCNIIVTQPRRISAISNAERVAEERGEKVGDTIGYQVRMESCVPPAPGRILYCTTGVLLTKLRSNPKLQGVSHVIVDEVHERDINTDFLLIFLLEMVKEGLPVKIVLMSASIDVHLLASYFQRAGAKKVPRLSVEGRLFPVTSHYLEDITRMIGWKRGTGMGEPETDVDLVVAVVTHVLKTTFDGALLVFLPGWEDISSVQNELQANLQHEGQKFVFYPLHSMISVGDQQKVFKRAPSGVRKVILSTNIAETSVTINDVVWVINTGTVKVKTFDLARRASCLNIKWCSKASTLQRSGRAGRCQPGHCFNLFTRRQQSFMDEYELPEMHRLPLEEIVLQAKMMKPTHPAAEFLAKALTPPPLSAASIAVKALTDLGALDTKEKLTELGRMLALLPVEPRVGRLILYAATFRTLNPILTIAASFGYKDPFVCPLLKRKEADAARLKVADGCRSDHILIAKAYDGWRKSIDANQETVFIQDNFLHRGTLLMIHGIRKQFLTQLRSFGFDVESDIVNQFSGSEVMVRAVLTAGLYPNIVKVAKMMESGGTRGNYVKRRVRNGCKTLQDGRVFLHPSSVNSDNLQSFAWFVYFEKVKTSNVQVKDCTLIDPIHMLLFGGNTLESFAQSDGLVQARIDNVDMYAFLMQSQVIDLLVCAREGIRLVLENTLMKTTSRGASVQPEYNGFVIALDKFLSLTALCVISS